MDLNGVVLRPKQLELLEEISESSLLIAPTGFGKTLMMAAAIAKLNLEGVLILTPTNILKDQLSKEFLKFLPGKKVFNISSGDAGCVDFETVGIRCMTAHMYAQFLIKKPEKIKSWSKDCLILDEVHRYRNSKTNLADLISKSIVNFTPRIVLGFTASPGSSHHEKSLCKTLFLKKILRAKEEILHERKIEHFKLKMSPQSKNLEQKFIDYISNSPYRVLLKILGPNIVTDHPGKLVKTTDLTLKRLRMLGGFKLISLYYKFFSLMHHHHLYLYQSQSTAKKYASEKDILKNLPSFYYSEPEVNLKFEKINSEYLKLKSGCLLVFVENYDTALALKEYLLEKGVPLNEIGLLAGKSKMSLKDRAQVLRLIDKGTLKIVMTTSVTEEGVDLKSAKLVVFYQPVGSYIRYIQRIGRTARHESGTVIILYYEKTHEERILKSLISTKESMEKRLK